MPATAMCSCFWSEQRHTNHDQPVEGRITYRFHPRCGETVLITRRLESGGVEFAVLRQPDGSLACLPAWMMQAEASRFEISDVPCFSLDVLRSLRGEVDVLLGFLRSESQTERAENDSSIPKSPTEPVQGRPASRPAAAHPN